MRVQTRREYHRTVLRLARQLLEDPLAEPDLTELSATVGFSPDHLNRFFREVAGEPLGAFVRRLRLERAAYHLKQGAVVAVASELAGYAEPEAFAKAFRRAFAQAPSAFAAGGASWVLPAPSKTHWGGAGIQPAIPEAEDFGVMFEERKPTRLYGKLYVGDFAKIPGEWQVFGSMLDDDLKAKLEWVSVFHSDGMRTERRDDMRAHLAYVDRPGVPILSGFEPIELLGGSYAASTVLKGPAMHTKAWHFFNRTWVPKRGPRPEILPGFDVYEAFPSPWSELRARIFLRLE